MGRSPRSPGCQCGRLSRLPRLAAPAHQPVTCGRKSCEAALALAARNCEKKAGARLGGPKSWGRGSEASGPLQHPSQPGSPVISGGAEAAGHRVAATGSGPCRRASWAPSGSQLSHPPAEGDFVCSVLFPPGRKAWPGSPFRAPTGSQAGAHCLCPNRPHCQRPWFGPAWGRGCREARGRPRPPGPPCHPRGCSEDPGPSLLAGTSLGSGNGVWGPG